MRRSPYGSKPFTRWKMELHSNVSATMYKSHIIGVDEPEITDHTKHTYATRRRGQDAEVDRETGFILLSLQDISIHKMHFNKLEAEKHTKIHTPHEAGSSRQWAEIRFVDDFEEELRKDIFREEKAREIFQIRIEEIF